MHTLEQATQLGCPLRKTTCEGDACMMWRWAASAKFRMESRVEPHPFEDGRDVVVPVKIRSRSAYGYCGLAGRPEVFEL